jgi:hypothetical protein
MAAFLQVIGALEASGGFGSWCHRHQAKYVLPSARTDIARKSITLGLSVIYRSTNNEPSVLA